MHHKGWAAAPVFDQMNVQENNCQVLSFFILLEGTKGSRRI